MFLSGCSKVNNSENSQSNKTIENIFVSTTPSQKINMLFSLFKEYKATDSISRKEEIKTQIKNLFRSYDNNVKNSDDFTIRAIAHNLLCKMGDKDALDLSEKAKVYLEKLESLCKNPDGTSKVLFLGKIPPVSIACEKATDEEFEIIKEVLKITGRNKYSKFFGELKTLVNYSIGDLQCEYKIGLYDEVRKSLVPGWSYNNASAFVPYGTIFGEKTKNVLLLELKKFIPEE